MPIRPATFFAALMLVFLFSCEAGDGDADTEATPPAPDTTAITAAPQTYASRATLQTCEPEGEILPGNSFDKFPPYLLTIAAHADETTPAHRYVDLYDRQTCERIAHHLLPQDGSDDYPYYLANLQYIRFTRVAGIRGDRTVVGFDIDRREALPPVTPDFGKLDRVIGPDFGRIVHLEALEQFLIGYAQEAGSFIYRIEEGKLDQLQPLATGPVRGEEAPRRLFVLDHRQDGTSYLCVPTYDMEEGSFRPDMIFPAAVNLRAGASRQLNKNFARVQLADGTLYLVDLRNGRLLDTPAGMQSANDQALRDYAANIGPGK